MSCKRFSSLVNTLLFSLMPVTFGFSLGDFIAGIGLLINIFQSLNETDGARADYQELWRELKNVRNGLKCVQSLSVDSVHPTQAAVVRAALDDCLSCVVGFIQKDNYSGLGCTPASSKNSRRMMQRESWDMADVVKFKNEVQQLLLAKVQV